MVFTHTSIDAIISEVSDTMKVSPTRSNNGIKKMRKVNVEGYGNIKFCLVTFLIVHKFI